MNIKIQKNIYNNLILLDNSKQYIDKKNIFFIINDVATNTYITIILNKKIIYTKSLGVLHILNRDRRNKNKIIKLFKDAFNTVVKILIEKNNNINSIVMIIKNLFKMKKNLKYLKNFKLYLIQQMQINFKNIYINNEIENKINILLLKWYKLYINNNKNNIKPIINKQELIKLDKIINKKIKIFKTKIHNKYIILKNKLYFIYFKLNFISTQPFGYPQKKIKRADIKYW